MAKDIKEKFCFLGKNSERTNIDLFKQLSPKKMILRQRKCLPTLVFFGKNCYNTMVCGNCTYILSDFKKVCSKCNFTRYNTLCKMSYL